MSLDEEYPESRLETWKRLKKEGRWEEVMRFKQAVLDELHRAKIWGQDAKRISWAEVRRRFPPLVATESSDDASGEAEAEPAAEREDESEPVDDDPEPVEAGGDWSFGLLPADWPPLPDNAPLDKEWDWAYQNGFLVISVAKDTNRTTLRWERASSLPPSKGACKLMELLAENRSKFFDLLKVAKPNAAGGDTAVERREKKRIEEIEAILQSLEEASHDDAAVVGRPDAAGQREPGEKSGDARA